MSGLSAEFGSRQQSFSHDSRAAGVYLILRNRLWLSNVLGSTIRVRCSNRQLLRVVIRRYIVFFSRNASLRYAVCSNTMQQSRESYDFRMRNMGIPNNMDVVRSICSFNYKMGPSRRDNLPRFTAHLKLLPQHKTSITFFKNKITSSK
jgi:hypothetical protein